MLPCDCRDKRDGMPFPTRIVRWGCALHVMPPCLPPLTGGWQHILSRCCPSDRSRRQAWPPAARVGRIGSSPLFPEISDQAHPERGRPGGRGKIAHVAAEPADARHLETLALLRRVRDRIDREYAQPLDVEALARGAHMSAGHLSRQFRLAYGESPYSYLMTRRIERAMALLRRGDLSVTEVCFAVGCSSLGTFSTRFTELVGVPPSVYGREATGATAGLAPCIAKQVTRPVRASRQR